MSQLLHDFGHLGVDQTKGLEQQAVIGPGEGMFIDDHIDRRLQ